MIDWENCKCDCCGIQVPKSEPELARWDWFKGTLPRVYHYCNRCINTDEARKMYEKSRKSRTVS